MNPEIPHEIHYEIWTRVFRSYAVTQSSDYAIRAVLEDFPPERINRFAAEEIARDAIDCVHASLRGFARMIAQRADEMYMKTSEEGET